MEKTFESVNISTTAAFFGAPCQITMEAAGSVLEHRRLLSVSYLMTASQYLHGRPSLPEYRHHLCRHRLPYFLEHSDCRGEFG